MKSLECFLIVLISFRTYGQEFSIVNNVLPIININGDK